MSKKLFPNLGVINSPKASKVSRQNMDNVFNSLLNLCSSQSHESMSPFMAILTMTYSRIQVLFNEDPSQCLQYLKLTRKWFLEYIRGGKCPNPGLRAWHWDTALNCPIFLSDVVTFFDANMFGKGLDRLFGWRIVIGLLSLDRVMMVTGTPNYKTITSPGVVIDTSKDLYPKNIASLVSHLGFTPKQFRDRYDYEVKTFEYSVLTSAGVNGQATWTAHSDARAFLASGDLLSTLKTFLDLSGLDYMFTDMVNTVKVPTTDSTRFDDLRLGRLHSFDEWGGKVRTVAIVDYWTQMALTPLHNTINHFLSSCPMDGTMNQDRIADIVCGWTSSAKEPIYSFDLTAATDRLPISLQIDILTVLLGSAELASSWAHLLVGRDYVTESGDKMRYAVGQPMGARSSFPMLALTHHIIVQHALTLSKVAARTNYVVLGDDMTMLNSEAATNYRGIMHLLGVPINMDKSVVPWEGRVAAAEICKRIFVQGLEVTTIPVKLIAKTVRDNSLAPILQSEFSKKGFVWSSATLTTFFYSVLNEQSFKDLMILNALPSSVSGLHTNVKIDNFPAMDIKNWYPSLEKFSDTIVENVFVWTAATEALKRVDALMRNTLAIGVAISEKMSLYTNSPVSVISLWEILGIPTDVPTEIVNGLIGDISSLSPSHPIIKASEAEIKRITELMSGLISHDVNMYNKTKGALLDICRNALTDVWTDVEAARASGIRTLVNKALTNLDTMVNKGYEIKGSDNKVVNDTSLMVMDYNLTITTVGRQWSVKVGYNFGTTVNAVKSKVNMSAHGLDTRISDVLSNLTIGRMSKTNK